MDETECGKRDNSKKSRVDTDEDSEDSDASQGKTEQSLLTKTLKQKLQEAWVQCEKPDCLKWRTISKAGAKLLGDEPWFCYMNEDLRYSSCDVPEEDTWEAEEMVERCRLIYIRSILPVGSLVWAKMPGYSWWPGVVVVDVDYDVSVSMDCDGDPLSYHIEFLGPKRSHAWIPEHMVEIFGDHVPFDPSAGRHEKTSGVERKIFKGFSVKEAVKEANSFQVMTLKERLSRCHFQPYTSVATSSKTCIREDRPKKKRPNPAASEGKAVCRKTKRPDEQIGSQYDDKKKKKKAKLDTGAKLPLKKDAAKEKRCSDDEPALKIRKLIPDVLSQKSINRSGDHGSPEQKSNKSETIASIVNELNSSAAAENDVEDDDVHEARVIPDVDEARVVSDIHEARVISDIDEASVVPDIDDVEKRAKENRVEKTTNAKQTSKTVKAAKPSFMVPSSGSSSKPLESNANNGLKKGFCPPVKTKKPEHTSSSSAAAANTVNRVKPKAGANEKAKHVAVDRVAKNAVAIDQSDIAKVNEDAELSGDEEASAFDELADEVCSVAAEEEQQEQQEEEMGPGGGLQELLGQSASLVGRTKEEKFTIDVQTYKENHDRFEQDVRKFMSQNKQRMYKLPVWETRCIGLFELFLATHDRGGYDTVCQKRLWTEIYSELTGVSTAKPNSKTKNYYKKYLLPYELHINGREYKHLFTKPEAGGEAKKAKKPPKSTGDEGKAGAKRSKKSEAKEQTNAELRQDDADDVESESAELEKLMHDLNEYDILCQSQVSACLQHDITTDNPTTPKKKLTSTPAKRADRRNSFLCDMDDDVLNDGDIGAHIVPLACTVSPVFSSDRESSCELQEMESLKHELISMQQHLDEMNNSLL